MAAARTWTNPYPGVYLSLLTLRDGRQEYHLSNDGTGDSCAYVLVQATAANKPAVATADPQGRRVGVMLPADWKPIPYPIGVSAFLRILGLEP